jgi:anti-sigma factor RsiW
MNCREFIEFLIDYTTGELADPQKAEFDAHMRECPDCVAYLENYRTTIRLSRDALRGDEPLPADVPDKLIKAILAARRT